MVGWYNNNNLVHIIRWLLLINYVRIIAFLFIIIIIIIIIWKYSKIVSILNLIFFYWNANFLFCLWLLLSISKMIQWHAYNVCMKFFFTPRDVSHWRMLKSNSEEDKNNDTTFELNITSMSERVSEWKKDCIYIEIKQINFFFLSHKVCEGIC